MEYKELVKDFVNRTNKNLEFIEKRKFIEKSQETEGKVYEFTQLVNSLFGLIIIPSELKHDKIKDNNDNLIDAKILTQLQENIIGDDYNNMEFKEILRRIRNALAHGNFEIKANDGKIIGIEFTDKHNGDKTDKNPEMNKNPKTEKEFKIKMGCVLLRKFVKDFSEKLVKLL